MKNRIFCLKYFLNCTNFPLLFYQLIKEVYDFSIHKNHNYLVKYNLSQFLLNENLLFF
ncbi:hypothetical protein [uncultured Fusobacterium sp.]|uniref:hypothetical protein n=1 Tax=uncultured Fusobacterium sp. TaxID=159267 RepID=UPI003437AB32